MIKLKVITKAQALNQTFIASVYRESLGTLELPIKGEDFGE
ncbi:MAG: hypothetical protein ABSD92_07485 [Candidatus Bathyarchaeia archaeon]